MHENTRLLTRLEVQSKCRIARSSVYRLMRAGLFPSPIRIGVRSVRWRESEIDEYLATRPRATGEVDQQPDVEC